MSALVSVVMPVRNGADSVLGAVQSILTQSLRNLELIVVDDHSEDGTCEVLRGISDKRVKIVQNQGGAGISAALNAGFQVAVGEYVARMDADDKSHSQRLKRQVAFLERNHNIDVCGTALKLSTGAVWKYPRNHPEIEARLIFESALAHPSVMFRASSIKRVALFYDSSMDGAEDYDLWVRYSRSLRYANIPRVSYFYHIDPQSVEERENDRCLISDRNRLSMLRRLGLKPCDSELLLHRAISYWRADQIDLQEADRWFQKLESANISSNALDHAAFMNNLFQRMFGLAWLAVKDDFSAVSRLRTLAFRPRKGFRWFDEQRLFLKAFKYRYGAHRE